MFRISAESRTPDLFRNFVGHLKGARAKKFDNPNAWHNLFWKHITRKVKEKCFKPLFTEEGRPNAPLRVLVGMEILQEGYGWSDRRMFDECDFNIQVMQALGLTNVNDETPCEKTYYNFRRALHRHQVKTGESIMQKLWADLTKEQAKWFGVNGKAMRMDSKLIGSNISESGRLELILNVSMVFYKDIKDKGLESLMTEADKTTCEKLLKKKAGQHIYEMDRTEKQKMLEQMGYLLMRMQGLYREEESEKYHLIVRVLSEQYRIEAEEKVILREAKEIKSDSLQSPDDEDAAYRKKNDTEVRGYSVNVTETCNEEGLNLITDVKMEKANAADNAFVQDAIVRSEDVVGNCEKVNADGAYHSPENQAFAQKEGIDFIVSAMPGKECGYDFRVKEGENTLPEVEVINKATGQVHQARVYEGIKDGNPEIKCAIEEEDCTRYFLFTWIMAHLAMLTKMQRDVSEIWRRNNVEATIFQMSHLTHNNKTRYRGLWANQMWAWNRSLWVNFRRIVLYANRPLVGGVCPDEPKNGKNNEILTKTERISTKSAAGLCAFLVRWLLGLVFDRSNGLQPAPAMSWSKHKNRGFYG